MALSKKVIFAILCFFAGIALSDYVYILPFFVFLILTCTAAICVYLRKFFAVFLLCSFAFGVVYFHSSFLDPTDSSGVLYYVSENVEWKVVIDAEVDVRRTGQKLIVAVEGLSGKVLLNLPKYPQYKYGDVLFVKGLLEEPFVTEDFSYKKYLERYSVYAMMKNPKVEVVGHELNNPFYKTIFWLKDLLQKKINELWAEPFASFESGLLLGARKGIPDNIMEAFNITGLTHIIAISGYNISLVIVLVGAAFSGLSRKRRVILSVIFIIVFTILVGMSAAVVRAAIMGSIGLFAIYYGRSTAVTLTLLSSALLMNLYNPKILTYDVGFQLSFAATCGIVYVSPKIEKWFTHLPDFCGIREGLQMTVAAQISTLPIILFHFGRLSLVSPLANILVAPFIPLSMAFGAIAFLLSLISAFLARIFIGITWIFLEIIIQITLFCAKIPFASLDIGGFDMILLIGSYVLLWIWLKD